MAISLHLRRARSLSLSLSLSGSLSQLSSCYSSRAHRWGHVVSRLELICCRTTRVLHASNSLDRVQTSQYKLHATRMGQLSAALFPCPAIPALIRVPHPSPGTSGPPLPGNISRTSRWGRWEAESNGTVAG